MVAIDEEIAALRPAASVRKANRAMGLRLLKTWQRLHPDERLTQALALVQSHVLGADAAGGVRAGLDLRGHRSAQRA